MSAALARSPARGFSSSWGAATGGVVGRAKRQPRTSGQVMLIEIPRAPRPTLAPTAPASLSRPLIDHRDLVEATVTVDGDAVPFDHAAPMRQALLRSVPVLRRSSAWSFSLLSARRQSLMGKGQPILPNLFRLRVPKPFRSDIEALVGQALKFGRQKVSITEVEFSPLVPRACLGSRAVIVPDAEKKRALKAYLTAELKAIGIDRPVQIIDGHEDDDIPSDYLLPELDLEAGDSLYRLLAEWDFDNLQYADMELEAIAERKPGHILLQVEGARDLTPQGGHRIHGYECYLSGWGTTDDPTEGGLTDEESLIIQANGLGGLTQWGAGFFQ